MKNIFDLKNKEILVTGGAGGIGFSLAYQLSELGARITVTDLSYEKSKQASEKLFGDGHKFYSLDISNEDDIKSFFDECALKNNNFDVLINCAGIAIFSQALDMKSEDFKKTIDINLFGAFLISKYFAKSIIEKSSSGKIIHLASVSSYVSNLNYSAYSSSKAGLYQLIRVLGREWAEKGITVNAIGPAITKTSLTEEIFKDSDWESRSLSQIPMRRFGTPEDLIGTIVLLASDAGSFITGQTIFVDGGRTLT